MNIAWKIIIAFLFIWCLIMYAILDGFDVFALFNSKSKDYPKLSYKQFIDYYWVNPDKWYLCNNYVQYKYYINTRDVNYYTEYVKSFSFPFIDQFKYRKFKYDIETNAEAMKQSKLHNEAYRILLNGVQEDIDKLRRQSKNELNEAMKTMKEVKERIGQI